MQTAERVSQYDQTDNYVFKRSILAYHYAANLVSGTIVELGTGMGYGVEIIAPKCQKYITLDKYQPGIDISSYKNVAFLQQTFPPFTGVADNSADFVITFQVIEHMQNDHLFLKEIHRILKPGGKAIITTPNKPMSITRNPWHIREYTIQELITLCNTYFTNTEALGVFGNEKVMEYYQKNKESVRKITRFDIFNLQYNLPRWILQIPYDILNRYNRKKLHSKNTALTENIQMEDYSIKNAEANCFDLLYIITK